MTTTAWRSGRQPTASGPGSELALTSDPQPDHVSDSRAATRRQKGQAAGASARRDRSGGSLTLAPRRLITVLAATVTATAGLVLASPPGVQAAPEPQTSTVSAPYSGPASFSSRTRGCDVATFCEISGSADAASGRSEIAGSYHRTSPVDDAGSIWGQARQEVAYTVPRGAKTVTAVLTYRIDSASASAAPTAGHLFALSGMWARFSYESCVAPDCTSSSQQQTVASTLGPSGLPGPPQHVIAPRTETLTVTASGALPRTLLLQAHTFAFTRGGGEYGPYCLHWDGCDGPSVRAHAGRADVSIDATLLSVQVSAS